ncbi:MAG TPA: ATP-binding protein [Burkholderiales bacterium]|nr:ATP-binding protein [Burkholderiales bacterium]
MVEDSEDDYEILRIRLSQIGFDARLRRVEDEPGMRAALAAGQWDIVVCDHKLPRFSFEAALATLRARDPDTPLIVVSGAIGEEAAVDAMLGGAEDFIVKGNLARLPGAIRRAIKSAESRRRQRRAEHALRESEGLLRSLASNLPAMIFRMDYERATGSFSLPYVGEGSTRIFAARPQRLRADPQLLARAIAPEDRDAFVTWLAGAAGDDANLSWQGRLDPEIAGAERWIQIQATRREASASHVQWDGIAFDISDLKRAEGEVRELTAHLEQVKETERAGVAREIHDDIGAIFFGLKVDLAWLRKRVGDNPALGERLDSIDAQLESGIRASQRIVHLLRPPVLDYGVVAAIEWLTRDFAKRTGIACTFSANVEELALTPEYGTAVFRVLQESLTNILRHAAATTVKVDFEAQAGRIRLRVQDNGRGIVPGALAKRTSFGLRGMRERALELGGSFELGASEGGGTQLALTLPLRTPAAESA